MKKRATFACLLLLIPGVLPGTPITFSGSQGDLSASAMFAVVGNDLVVTLTNTSTADVLAPTGVLTAMFFNLSGQTLVRQSAVLGTGSTVLFGTTDPGGAVGGEWTYSCGLSGAPAICGISSTGLGLFGPFNLFPGSNLAGPVSPDGLQYGLTSAGDNPLTGNTTVTGDNALIQNQAVFTLSGLSSGFDPKTDVSRVWFQYGTALSDPRVPSQVPEPVTWGALGTGLIALGVLRRRFQYRQSKG